MEMENVTLGENEVFAINNFLEAVSNIKMVEGVYAIAYVYGMKKKKRVELVVLPNVTLSYNAKLTGKEQSRLQEECVESKQLYETITKYNELFKGKRLDFSYSENLIRGTTAMHKREYTAERGLASGTLLYDRFGDLLTHQKDAVDEYGQYTNTLDITNIDKITNLESRAIQKVK